ncbi:MAG: cyclic peptide export ABC transporter [Acidobacteriota bacterium]|nr:cyclic peptide export ABC transporter [Acidobacteriota bacterium]
MNIIKFLLRNSRGLALLAITAGALSGSSGAALIALVHASLGADSAALSQMQWQYVGLCVALLVTQYASQVFVLRLSQGAIYDMRLRLSKSIINAPLRRLEEAGSPRLMAALTGDAATISSALINVPIICINLATMVTCLIYVGVLSWQLLAGLLVFMALSILSYRLTVKKAVRHLKRAREEADTLFAHFRAVIEGNKELKLHRQRREEFHAEEITTSAAAVRQHNQRGITTYIIADGWGRLLYFVFIGLLIYAVPRAAAVTVQDLTGYILIILYIRTPITVLLNVIPSFSEAEVALHKVNSLGLSLQKEIRKDSPERPSEVDAGWQSIELDGVMHAYSTDREEGSFALGPIDLTFSPGDLVFLVGGNGSGKSTFAKILTGLYVPEAGAIRLDGQPITSETRDSYRQLFSAVFSDYYLFERVAGADDPGLDARAQEYLVQLQLDHKLRVEDRKFSTTALSQGQRKRLTLLNAYLEDRPFYVFDEWASDQDPLFKRVFYTQLLPELKARGKAVLVITHDDQYYHVADRVVKLDYGHSVPDRTDAQTSDAEVAFA